MSKGLMRQSTSSAKFVMKSGLNNLIDEGAGDRRMKKGLRL